MQQGVVLGIRIVKRIVLSFSVVVVNTISRWANANMSMVQCMCLIALIFITATQLNKTAVQPKLLRLVCLLYCNQQIRRLFTSGSDTAIDFIPNVLLATTLAVFLTVLAQKENKESVDDLRTMLEALLYMYGDMLDFLFKYGVLSLTLMAFAVGLFIQTMPPPVDPMRTFFTRMAGIVSTNILYQGVTSLINSSKHMKLVESIATASVLRIIIPSMESYLTYLTAAQLTLITPAIAPVMLCIIVWIEVLPPLSRGWISELCATYVILSVMNYLSTTLTWGATVILIMAHYVDYIIVHLD